MISLTEDNPEPTYQRFCSLLDKAEKTIAKNSKQTSENDLKHIANVLFIPLGETSFSYKMKKEEKHDQRIHKRNSRRRKFKKTLKVQGLCKLSLTGRWILQRLLPDGYAIKNASLCVTPDKRLVVNIKHFHLTRKGKVIENQEEVELAWLPKNNPQNNNT